jgi:hypothetical protein
MNAAFGRTLYWCDTVNDPFIGQSTETANGRAGICPRCDWVDEPASEERDGLAITVYTDNFMKCHRRLCGIGPGGIFKVECKVS